MVFSPIFGYLGDRYSRKLLMAVGIFFWSFITLGSSFIGPESYWLFLMMRALVGIGEASYSTIAPTLIADLFVGTARTKALSVFYFAIPVGSGLGYIVGSKVAYALGNWQWALRVTPGLGLVCVFLILVIVREPQRGAADGGMHITSTSWFADLAYLFKHKSFMLSSAGFTCVAFCAGALSLWFPTYMFYSIRQKPEDADESTVSMIFGLITCASGFCGVAIGSWSASKIRRRKDSRGVLIGCKADPLVCAVGMIGCSFFMYLTLLYSRENPIATWILIFIGETFLSLNWALVTDMVLYIVVPTRRATAEALQILMCHALGDAGSPYLIGQAADSITAMDGFSTYRAGQYLGLQYSMYMCCFVSVLGGAFFLATSLYITEDKANTEKAILASIPKKPITKTEADTEDTGDSPADSHQNVIA